MKIDEKTGLYENYGPWHVPFWQTDTFYLILKIVIICLLLFLVFFLYRMYMQKKRRKKLSAWDEALQKLKHARELQISEQHSGKDFYVSLTSIMKKYLHDRFGYDVVGKTDDEVITYLQTQQCDASIIHELSHIMQGSVVIKFANQKAAIDQMHQDYDRCVKIIQQTIPCKK